MLLENDGFSEGVDVTIMYQHISCFVLWLVFFFLFFLVLRLFTGIGCGTERSTCGERESAVQCVCVFKRDRERERENVCM